MGVSSSNLCCYCHSHHGACCKGNRHVATKERGCAEQHRYGDRSLFYSVECDENQSPPASYLPSHCDNESMQSFCQEISRCCPVRCRRKKQKKRRGLETGHPEKRSSFVYQDTATPSPMSHLCGGSYSPYPAESNYPSRPSSNGMSHEKSNRSSINSSHSRTRPRRPSDFGFCHMHKHNTRRNRMPGSTSCVSQSSTRHRGIPPFPLYLDDCGGDRENFTKNHNTYMMSTDSQKSMEEWVRAIRKASKLPSGSGIFGQELDRTIKFEKQIDSKLPPGKRTTKREVPYIIETCCEFIRQNGGFLEEGLFRLPGQANEVQILQDSFDMGERPSFDKSTDTHTVTSLMKSFLRQLPEPPIPYDQYSPLIEAAQTMLPGGIPSYTKFPTSGPDGGENDEIAFKARDVIKKQLAMIPRENFQLLRYLCRFLDEVQQHSKSNKMDIANLALMFGPNIMKSRNQDPMVIMSHASYVQLIMSEFIRNHSVYFPDDEIKSSLPDVAVDAASRHNEEKVMTSPSTSSQRHQNYTGTAISSHTTQTTSTDGFNTMTTQTTTSPPGTIGFRHITDDSGTGSLGPTPDNTSRRNAGAPAAHLTGGKMRPDVPANRPKPASAIYEENASGAQSPSSKKPSYPLKAPKPSLDADVNRRESFYDNVTQSSEASSYGNAMRNKYRDSGPKAGMQKDRRSNDGSIRTEGADRDGGNSGNTSQRSSYANQISPGVSSARSSTNAVAGSSVGSIMSYDMDTLPYSPTLSMQEPGPDSQRFSMRTEGDVSSKGPKPPMRKKRSKKNVLNGVRHGTGNPSSGTYISDEESNTESVPPDDRSMMSSRQSSMSSINDARHPRTYSGGAKRPSQRPPPPPYPAGHPRSQGRNPSTTEQPTYDELQESIRMLEEKLRKQSGEFESKTRFLEESFLRQIHELRCSSLNVDDLSSRFPEPRSVSQASEADQYWRPGAASNLAEDTDSLADTVSEAIHFDPVTQRYDLESKATTSREFKSTDEQIQHLQKCVSEERKLRQMTEIQLKNEKRGRLAAEERNEQLQKEMREFFCTFGSMFNNSETSSLQ